MLQGDKSLVQQIGFETISGEEVRGYEMHIGKTDGPDTARPWLTLANGRPEGAISADGRIFASYLHGIFTADRFRRRFLENVGTVSSCTMYEALVEEALEELASHMEQHLDLNALLSLAM